VTGKTVENVITYQQVHIIYTLELKFTFCTILFEIYRSKSKSDKRREFIYTTLSPATDSMSSSIVRLYSGQRLTVSFHKDFLFGLIDHKFFVSAVFFLSLQAPEGVYCPQLTKLSPEMLWACAIDGVHICPVKKVSRIKTLMALRNEFLVLFLYI